MDDELKPTKKKRSKKDPASDVPNMAALAKLTSSDVIRQVKAGLSRIAPLEPENDEPFNSEEPQP